MAIFIKIHLNEEWNRTQQRIALDILLQGTSIQRLWAGKEVEVWALTQRDAAADYDCDKNSCNIIGLRECNTNSLQNNALIALVGTQTKRVYDVQYSN
jgi:hypothetical protein